MSQYDLKQFASALFRNIGISDTILRLTKIPEGCFRCKDEQWPLDLKVSSFNGQRSYAKCVSMWERERERERERYAFIRFHCHWNWNHPAIPGKRKEGKDLRNFRRRGGNATEIETEERKRRRNDEPSVGTAATLVIPRLKASFNIYDLFRFNSTCKQQDAFRIQQCLRTRSVDSSRRLLDMC